MCPTANAFLLKDDRATSLSRVPAAGGAIAMVLVGGREVNNYALACTGQVTVLSSQPQQPAEVFGLDKKEFPKPLSKQKMSGCAASHSAPLKPFRRRLKTAQW